MRKPAKPDMTASSVKRPVAPPVYRPQPVPKVLQTKKAAVPELICQRKKLAVAPPAYRPQPEPKVLQRKAAPTAIRPQAVRNAVAQPSKQAKPLAPPFRTPNSVIQRSEKVFLSQTAQRHYKVRKRFDGDKFHLDMFEEGSSAVLATMRYKFYPDGLAVMEHVEAYGMPQGTRAAYLLFYMFADHALQAGSNHVGIGTGVTERSVTRNLAEARETGNHEMEAEYNRSMGAVHIYRELGFDPTDAGTLSTSTMTPDAVRTTAVQKLGGYWLRVTKAECVLL